MTNTRYFLSGLLVPALAALFASSANAQATRTWVSGVGDDVNPCSRTAPCKTFAGAISKTSAGGEIDALDPGGFGAVTITKAISIFDDGVGEAGVLVSGTNGIVVAAGSADVVNLRGLIIDGVGTGLAGVSFISGATLNIENSRIMNFNGNTAAGGIAFKPSAASQLHVTNTIISNNGLSGGTFGGILIQPQSGGEATAVLNQVTVENNLGTGIRIDSTVAGALGNNVTITNSVSSGNTGMGIQVITASGVANAVMVDTVTSANNTTFGVRSQVAGSNVTLTRSTVTGNATGIGESGGATLASYGNNNVSGNGTDGSPSTVLTAK